MSPFLWGGTAWSKPISRLAQSPWCLQVYINMHNLTKVTSTLRELRLYRAPISSRSSTAIWSVYRHIKCNHRLQILLTVASLLKGGNHLSKWKGHVMTEGIQWGQGVRKTAVRRLKSRCGETDVSSTPHPQLIYYLFYFSRHTVVQGETPDIPGKYILCQ